MAEPAALPTTPSAPPPRSRPALRRIGKALLFLLGLLGVLLAVGGLWVRGQVRASLPRLEGELALAGLAAPVTVERDALGVPTIRSDSRVDGARALGFLHAQDRFFQMDLLRRSSAGELSALFGALAIDVDKANRLHRFRHVAGRVLARATPEERAVFEAYAAGVNAGLAALGAKPWEYFVLRTDPQPWVPEDTVLTVYAMFLDLQDGEGGYESDVGLVHDLLPLPLAQFLTPVGTAWDAPLVGSPLASPPVPGPEVLDLRQEPRVELPRAAERARSPFATDGAERMARGSNNWAVAGAHTADGRALLANDMHLGLRVPNTWYRASLVRPDGAGGTMRITGVSLPGAPVIVVGSNGHVAWGFTNSYGDWSDLILLELDPRNPEAYRTPDGWRRFERTEEVIEVKGGAPVRLPVRSTIWGPVLDQDHRGRLRALAWTAHHPEAVNLTLMEMDGARTLDEALAVAWRSGAPAQNFVAADAAGRIGWTILGQMPRRVGFDGRVPTSWADGTHRWDGWLSPGEVPRVVDPPAGRVWTANTRVVEGDLLAKVGDGGYFLGARARQIRDGLLALDKATPRDLLAVQLDDRALFLAPWHQLLLRTLTPEAVAADPRRRELRHLLETTWTGRASIDSVAFRFVRAWHDRVVAQVLTPITARCEKADARFVPDRGQAEGPAWELLRTRPAHLLDPAHSSWDAALLASVDAVLDQWARDTPGPLADRTWGERNATRIRHPLSGAIPFLGRWIDMPPRPLPGDADLPRFQRAAFGASERLVVSPGHEEEGTFHMPGGQSGHPLSPYYRAGHTAWEEGRPTPFLPGPVERTLRLVP